MPKRKAQQAAVSSEEEFSDSEEQQQGSDSGDSTSDDSDDSSDFPSGDESGSESEESEDDEEGAAFDSINVDFEFFDPQEKDFHGLKALLHTYLDGEQFNCSELVDAIINQAAVGTVIKCGEDDDPIGICTVLSLRQHSQLKSLAEFKSFLLAHCPDKGGKQALEKAWEAKGTGLVVSERLINCPPQLAPPLQQNLFEEIKGAAEDEEEEQAVRDAFTLQRYILVARVYSEPSEEEEEEGQQQQQGGEGKQKKGKAGAKKQKQAPAAPAAADLVYATPEAEVFHKHASWSFTFRTPNRPVGKHDLVPHRLVMEVQAAKVPRALKELEALVAAGGGGDD